MRHVMLAAVVLLLASPASAQSGQPQEFGSDWHVAPSPDPERLRIESGQTLRIRGLLEVPYPAACSTFAKTSYLIDEKSFLRLALERGKVETDSFHFR